MWGFCFLAWFSLGCRVTLGLLDDFFFFVPFLLHYHSVKWRHVLCCDITIETFLYAAWRPVSAGVCLTDLNLSPYRLTDSQDLEKGKFYQQQSIFSNLQIIHFFFFFRYCFEDNLQPYPKRLRCTRGADLSFYWPLCIFTICWPI